MNAGELFSSYREESNDKAVPPFVSNARLLQFATEAEREACRRASLLIDSSSAMCSVSVSANDPLVLIDPRILDIRRAKLSISTYSLSPVTAEAMDRVNPGWETHVGTPTTYVTDYQTSAIRLYPKLQVDAELNMTVSRLPMYALRDESSRLEIKEEYHPAIVQWLLYRSYATQDADLFDPNKSAKALAEFEREFGKKASGRNERWQKERPMLDTPTIA